MISCVDLDTKLRTENLPDDKMQEKKNNFLYFYFKRKKTSTDIRAKNGANLFTIEGSRLNVQIIAPRM